MPETAYVPDPRAYPLQWIPSQELDGGGGNGDTQVYTGAAAPATPDDPTLPAIFYPTGGGSIQQWDVSSQQWL